MSSIRRKSPSFWDDLTVPAGTKPAHLFSWLEEVCPTPEEHDYVLSTDGSGCVKGWGASASMIQKAIPDDLLGRRLDGYRPIISATYGSTVQRRELSAMLDGLHEILCLEMLAREAPEVEEGEPALNSLLRFSGDDRITVLWYTDRANLAKSLLFDEYGSVLNKRTAETDLWMRYSSMARCFCITPMWTTRNLIPAQSACDAACSIARRALKESEELLRTAIGPALHESWNQPRPQKAHF